MEFCRDLRHQKTMSHSLGYRAALFFRRMVGVRVLRDPSRVSRLGFVSAPMSVNGGQPNFAQCLAVSWAGTLYIRFFLGGGLLPAAKSTLRPNLPFCYMAALLHGTGAVGGSLSKFAAWYKEWNYGTFAEGATYIRQGGHHVGHRPTF